MVKTAIQFNFSTMKLISTLGKGIGCALLLSSCSGGFNIFSKKPEKSKVTGWNYNAKTMGNFSVMKPKDINTAPGLVFVQGGTFTMGATQEDVMADWNNAQEG